MGEHVIPQRKTIPVEELAKQLGVSRNFAYGRVKSGEIPAVRVGRRWLIPADAADRLLQSAFHSEVKA